MLWTKCCEVLNISLAVPLRSVSSAAIINPDTKPDPAFYNPFDTSLYPQNILSPDPSLASYCSPIWTSNILDWERTWPLTTETWMIPLYTGPATGSALIATGTSFETAIQSVYGTPDIHYSPPCCLTCTVFGDRVQVFYWPTTTPTPVASVLVNDAGFTL